MATFQTGRTYQTRSLCDHDYIISVTIAKRTEKTVTDSKGKTFRIAKDYTGSEMIRPRGRHSMAPTISATE